MTFLSFHLNTVLDSACVAKAAAYQRRALLHVRRENRSLQRKNDAFLFSKFHVAPELQKKELTDLFVRYGTIAA